MEWLNYRLGGWNMGDEVRGTTLGRALYVIIRVVIFFLYRTNVYCCKAHGSDFELLIETLKPRLTHVPVIVL